MAERLIGIFYGDFYELTLLESQRTSILSAAARMQRKCPWSICLPTKSDLLLSDTARLKLSYPATPCSVLSRHQHTHTHVNTHTHTDPPVLQAFIWSLPVSRLLCQNLFKTFHTAGFLCKYCVPCTRKNIKHGAQLQTNSAPLEEEKKKRNPDTSNRTG